ncbi:MAG TPA: AmmeMemoRadiSam system protein B [Candidatus Dormibacteraeota bacterium]|nr:AmmeMemoRadiSam system protein B [Candidatus Dormibacteraeota bacterium]
MIRQPVVAGHFYPALAAELERSLDLCLGGEEAKTPRLRAKGCLMPHAGYAYSGRVSGAVYRRIELPSRMILLGPRHDPAGQPMAILSEGEWLTPLGPARIDSELAAALKRACPLLREDAVAHQREHALEVHLPFLQKLAGDFRFVPVALGTIVLAALEELGEAIAEVAAAQGEPLLVLASSDMNHYESDSLTRHKDRLAIEKILQIDPAGLFETVRQHDISMCGFAAAVTMLFAARRMGATGAELVSYATSGDVTGDRESVVGYAGVVVF